MAAATTTLKVRGAPGRRTEGRRGALRVRNEVRVPPAWPGRAVVKEEERERLEAPLGATGPKRFSLIGSTGSIGTQTLDIVREHPDLFSVEAMACGSNVSLFAEQVAEFKPKLVAVGSEGVAHSLRARRRVIVAVVHYYHYYTIATAPAAADAACALLSA